MPVELLGKSAEELREYMASLGERPFRAAQLHHAMYAERRFDFSIMSNVPAALRERLAREARITPPRIVRRFPSVDGSIRYLFSIGGPAGEVSGTEMPSRRRLNPFSCRAKRGKRFAFPHRPGALWTVIFA